MKSLTEFRDDCIKEMFRRVGVEYSAEFVTDPKWFWKCEWTEEQETDFKKWLIKQMKKHSLLKHRADKEADWFLFMWGWKIRKDEAA